MASFRFPSLFATVLLAVALVGCDASTSDDPADTGVATPTEDAAVSIANALGAESGGALEDIGSAVDAAGRAANSGGPAGAGCERSLTYDDATVTWTHEVACERGVPDGRFYSAFARTHEFQFIAGDAPQPLPGGADALRFDIVEGSGERRTPVFRHLLTDLGASFDIAGLNEDLVTVNGTYTRSATDTLETRRAVRTLDYTLDLDFIDVVGPNGRTDRGGWENAVSGTIEGHYQAFVTFETPGGYREREIDQTFTIVLGGDEPVLALGRDRFGLDLAAGTVDVPMD